MSEVNRITVATPFPTTIGIAGERFLQHGGDATVLPIVAGVHIEVVRGAGTDSWFWSREWQEGEDEADADIADGRGTYFETNEDFVASL